MADPTAPATEEVPDAGPLRTLAVATAVSFACAVVVTASAIGLKPLQEANEQAERREQIMAIVDTLPGIEELFASVDARQVEARVVDLSSGEVAPSFTPDEVDPKNAEGEAAETVPIPPKEDIARIGERPRYAPVYLMKKDDRVRLVVLPVYGKGYLSMIHGFLALEGDANTVVAFSVYEQNETPGLGARVTDPEWREKWKGTKLRDEDGDLRVRVVKGGVEKGSKEAPYAVDAISGATRTSEGVENLIRFWVGEQAFGPWLERLRADGDRA